MSSIYTDVNGASQIRGYTNRQLFPMLQSFFVTRMFSGEALRQLIAKLGERRQSATSGTPLYRQVQGSSSFRIKHADKTKYSLGPDPS